MGPSENDFLQELGFNFTSDAVSFQQSKEVESSVSKKMS